METLKNICKDYELEAIPDFWRTPEYQIQEIYNGAGPDCLQNWQREILTYFLRLFRGAFIIHDFDFAVADKTREGFKKANKRMWRNMKKILDKEYPFWQWVNWRMRFRWWLKARLAYRACQKLGFDAWLDD